MKKLFLIPFVILPVLLSACADTQLWWPVEENNSKQQPSSNVEAKAASRPPLDVPPELRGEVQVPNASAIGTSEMPQATREMVSGAQVGLDSRAYKQDVGQVFSAVVDAMISMNLPVQSVDSASGTITTDWVRKNSNNSSLINTGMNLFGAGSNPTRYRFVVRVLRLQEGKATRLDVHSLGQIYTNNHWVNKPLKRKLSEEVFSAVEEQLTRQSAVEPAVSAPAAEQ